ncbi:hypothetical protein L7F22_050514 [Adiantum nelumboides]|nr:hypothetical protein [Adiantum nelumboides]
MANRRDDVTEEVSSSQGRQEIPMVFGVGESSRRPPVSTPLVSVNATQGQRPATEQFHEDAFRTQLVAAVNVFSQLMQNPRFLEFLQPPSMPQHVRQHPQQMEQVEAQQQVPVLSQQGREHSHVAESLGAPRPMFTAQELVTGTPVSQALPVQPATLMRPNVGPNGQGSSFQAMHQVFPPPTAHPGYFGGGSVFQSMAGYAPGNQLFMPGTMFGGMPGMMPNPMYGTIGCQPGFQGTQGYFGVPQDTFGIAGFSGQPANMAPGAQNLSDHGAHTASTTVPIMQTLPYDNLTALGKPKPYKEGGQAVKFETFSGFDDMTKALSFLQQFDTAFAGGNFTEASKAARENIDLFLSLMPEEALQAARNNLKLLDKPILLQYLDSGLE